MGENGQADVSLVRLVTSHEAFSPALFDLMLKQLNFFDSYLMFRYNYDQT